ncbi:MAG: hypothetical protein HY082_09200 [Gammaproteobacteria bacterium]|nr:hypothetical protein [Gammaproteobacteria bacterium]
MPIKIFFNLCLLRANPQDLPSSNRLLGVALVAHLAANLLAGLGETGLENALIAGAMDTLLLVALTHTGLMMRDLRQRTRQTLIALAGSGALFTILAWAAVAAAEMVTVTAQAWVVSLPFLFWFLAVYGHILRHAFNTSVGFGLLLATGYVLLSLLVTGPFLLADVPAE